MVLSVPVKGLSNVWSVFLYISRFVWLVLGFMQMCGLVDLVIGYEGHLHTDLSVWALNPANAVICSFEVVQLCHCNDLCWLRHV